MTDAARPGPYGDTPAPKVFGNVSPLDPQLFYRINDFADDLLQGERSGKYSPVEVAQWIEDYAAAAVKDLALAAEHASRKDRPDYRRLTIDIALEAALGRFFAAKFRSGVLYRIHEQTGDRSALEQSLKLYRAARDIWAELANRAKDVYLPDITVGEAPQLRGHWLDRLPAMDADIAAVARRLEQAKGGDPPPRVGEAIRAALGRPRRATLSCRHTPPERFRPGQAVDLELLTETAVAGIWVYYRHVNQAERYERAEMWGRAQVYQARIPAAYTESQYPLQYYFEWKLKDGGAGLYPGFGVDLANQPYFVIRKDTQA
jgi:hypothetical protein